MGVVFNGVTITAGTNKFYFNGTSVKDVYFNGVHVWSGLPTFNAGTGYLVTSNYRTGKSSSWITIKTITFKAADGSACSVRSGANGRTDHLGDGVFNFSGYGRVLKNGSQVSYKLKTGSSGGISKSSFVTVSLNYGDVLTIQQKGQSDCQGGGEVYTSTSSSGYWT